MLKRLILKLKEIVAKSESAKEKDCIMLYVVLGGSWILFCSVFLSAFYFLKKPAEDIVDFYLSTKSGSDVLVASSTVIFTVLLIGYLYLSIKRVRK